MKETLKVYGFGSSFKGPKQPQDLDLLLLHRSGERSSCEFAIACKHTLRRHLHRADVVMLSEAEARQNDFIARAFAVRLGEIDDDNLEQQAIDLSLKITSNSSSI